MLISSEVTNLALQGKFGEITKMIKEYTGKTLERTPDGDDPEEWDHLLTVLLASKGVDGHVGGRKELQKKLLDYMDEDDHTSCENHEFDCVQSRVWLEGLVD